MPRITVGTENGAPIEIHYEDHGGGDPVVMVHGYPLNGSSWERQERELLANGFRVITYDRRGFGRSSQPTVGYDYNTFAADLSDLLEHLDLRGVVLVGFSMGSGEVTRYLGTYGSGRVRKAALLGAIPPFLLRTDDNPDGVDRQVFEDIKAAIVGDRYAHFKAFFDDFYNVDRLMPDRISGPAWQASFNVAAGSSPFATYACVETWLTDFRRDLPRIDVPVLVVHGTEDRILPFRRPPPGSRHCSATSSSSRSREARTTSPGRMRTRSTRRCWSSSPRPSPPDALGMIAAQKAEIADNPRDAESQRRRRTGGGGVRPAAAPRARSGAGAPLRDDRSDRAARERPGGPWRAGDRQVGAARGGRGAGARARRHGRDDDGDAVRGAVRLRRAPPAAASVPRWPGSTSRIRSAGRSTSPSASPRATRPIPSWSVWRPSAWSPSARRRRRCCSSSTTRIGSIGRRPRCWRSSRGGSRWSR